MARARTYTTYCMDAGPCAHECRGRAKSWASVGAGSAQGLQQNGTEHDVPILTALAALDVDDHPLAIDVANLQASHFGARAPVA